MVNVNYMCSWVEHSTHFFKSITSLRHTDLLTDVTITCGDKQFRAHSLVLCASSDYFRRILVNNTQKSAYVHIMGVPPVFIQNILQYVYTGQIEITPSDVEPFLKLANDLKISGLCKEGSETDTISSNLIHKHEKVPETSSSNFPNHFVTSVGSSNLLAPSLNPPLNPPAVKPPGDFSLSRRSYESMEPHIALPQPVQKDMLVGNRFDPPIVPVSVGHTSPLEAAKGEQITIMPDISEMTEGYDSISEESADAHESEGKDDHDAAKVPSPPQSRRESSQHTPVNTNDVDVNTPPYKITLNSLAVDPAAARKRKTSEESDPAEKVGKFDQHSIQKHCDEPLKTRQSSSGTPILPLSVANSIIPKINPINCKKGHSGMYCNHRIVSLPDGRKVHFNKHDYDQWMKSAHSDGPTPFSPEYWMQSTKT